MKKNNILRIFKEFFGQKSKKLPRPDLHFWLFYVLKHTWNSSWWIFRCTISWPLAVNLETCVIMYDNLLLKVLTFPTSSFCNVIQWIFISVLYFFDICVWILIMYLVFLVIRSLFYLIFCIYFRYDAGEFGLQKRPLYEY